MSMNVECDDRTCNVQRLKKDLFVLGMCKNRPFAELKWRKANKHAYRAALGQDGKKQPNYFGDGIEPMETKGRGFGVRSMRSFEPGQVITEYTGEIITQEEADRRMKNEYKDHQVSPLLQPV